MADILLLFAVDICAYDQIKNVLPPAEENADVIVQSLQNITELVVWGDQHDPNVFETFMEMDILGLIRRMMIPAIDAIHIQVFQTLGIWMETLQTPTSKWFLMSRNYINEIISCPDINTDQDEGHRLSSHNLLPPSYILTMRCEGAGILYFSSQDAGAEHRGDFPLFTQAMKLCNHENVMVQTAVKNISLMTFQVREPTLDDWIATVAAPAVFANFVWNIGHSTFQLQKFVLENDCSSASGVVVQLLDAFQYIDDVIKTAHTNVAEVVRYKLLDDFLLPVCLCSLAASDKNHQMITNPIHRGSSTYMSCSTDQSFDSEKVLIPGVAFFVISQALQTFRDSKILFTLASKLISDTTFDDNESACRIRKTYSARPPSPLADILSSWEDGYHPDPRTGTPTRSSALGRSLSRHQKGNKNLCSFRFVDSDVTNVHGTEEQSNTFASTNIKALSELNFHSAEYNIDSSKIEAATTSLLSTSNDEESQSFSDSDIRSKCFMTLLNVLRCVPDDRHTLPGLCCLQALLETNVLGQTTLVPSGLVGPSSVTSIGEYNKELIHRLLLIVKRSSHVDARVKLVTLTMAARILHTLVTCSVPQSAQTTPRRHSALLEEHKAIVAHSVATSATHLKDFLTVAMASHSSSAFSLLEMFEVEYRRMEPLRLSHLLNSSAVMCNPDYMKRNDVSFEMRVANSDNERRQKSIQIFLLIRKLYLDMHMQHEQCLPLAQPLQQLNIRDSVSLDSGDAIPCRCNFEQNSNGQYQRRLLLVNEWNVIFLELNSRNCSQGIVRFVADLGRIHCERQKHNSRGLTLTVEDSPRTKPFSSSEKIILFTCHCLFDDNIRSLTAYQYIEKGRRDLQERKLSALQGLLLEMSALRTRIDTIS
eukprot:gene790-4078_t